MLVFTAAMLVLLFVRSFLKIHTYTMKTLLSPFKSINGYCKGSHFQLKIRLSLWLNSAP